MRSFESDAQFGNSLHLKIEGLFQKRSNRKKSTTGSSAINQHSFHFVTVIPFIVSNDEIFEEDD